MDSENQGRYADIGTQTSPSTPPILTVPSTDSSILTAVWPRVTNSVHQDRTLIKGSPEREERISTNKYTFTSDSPSSEHTLPLLPSFPSSFGLSRHTINSRLNPSANRSVSLPETLYDEDLRLVLSQFTDYNPSEAREQQRVVSMPDSLHTHAHSYPSENTYGHRQPTASSLEIGTRDGRGIGDSDDLRSSLSSPSTPGTIVIHSLSSDQFRTPSPPPSSCDSIEFTLEDPADVPDSFFRGPSSPSLFVPAVTSKANGLLEDDGWLTWANSPPRPIPALHGPSSLPYARCPSGAEGTIIGEPSSLSRMIWGLDPNDAVSTSHVPQSQPSRAITIRPPANNIKSRYGTQQAPASFASTPATIGSSHVGPRFGSHDYNSFEQIQGGREVSRGTPTTLDTRREEDSRDNFRRMTRGGPSNDLNLNVTVHEGPIQLESRHEHVLNDDGFMDYSRLLVRTGRVGLSDTVDRGFELLPVVNGIQRQRPPAIRNQEGIHTHSYGSSSRKGHPSSLVELLSSPVKLLDRTSHGYSRVATGAPQLSARRTSSSFLPTPPSSSSPQWSSVFSPLRNHRSSTAKFSNGSSDPYPDVDLRQQKHTANDELSDELRRFVFENMSPINSANAIDTVQAFPTSQTSATNVFLTARNGETSSESPAHPPGLPIPQHILLSKALEPFDPLSAHKPPSPKSAPPSPSSYTRSTLANPRSIPLSRLRQKRGAIKLATVPEEDSAEAHVLDGRLTSLACFPPRVFLRTPSPLDGRLHAQSAQSIEEKTAVGEDLTMGHARVKLPHTKGSDRGANLGPSQNTTPQGSPKRKRLQRRKRPVRPMEGGKPGIPLVAGGTMWFDSSTSISQEVRKEEDQTTIAYATSGRIESMGTGVSGRHDATTVARWSNQRLVT